MRVIRLNQNSQKMVIKYNIPPCPSHPSCSYSLNKLKLLGGLVEEMSVKNIYILFFKLLFLCKFASCGAHNILWDKYHCVQMFHADDDQTEIPFKAYKIKFQISQWEIVTPLNSVGILQFFCGDFNTCRRILGAQILRFKNRDPLSSFQLLCSPSQARPLIAQVCRVYLHRRWPLLTPATSEMLG